MAKVRPSILSGTWYPASPQRLRQLIGEFLAGADRAAHPGGTPLLVVVPHAGYAYSGETAGRLYGLLQGARYEQVFILAPSHRAHLSQIALPAAESFATPLGQVPVATEIVQQLAADQGYVIDEQAHSAEHAVEIQLPFLQEIFGAALRIIPLLVPALPAPARRAAAAALTPWCDGNSLLLVSTDFTHYGSAYGYIPFRDRIPERLQELDGGAIDRILQRDPDGLVAQAERTGITMCGLHAAALALDAPLPAGGDAVLVAYSRSGDRDRDYSLSVSYASLLLTGRAGPAESDAGEELEGRTAEPRPTDPPAEPPTGHLGATERGFLLALARRVVTAVAEGRPVPTCQEVARDLGQLLTANLQQKRGAFVTLTSGGRLRGCIGYIESIKPLAEAVAANAVSAASRDPRFRPVEAGELPDLHIEISALSPLRRLEKPQEIVTGRHGIVLHKGPAQAVFLPQVAAEQGWDRDTTLSHLALKAGLPADGWREGASFEVFEAEVFAEESA
jgi:AmmeMemoRadiSam system protein B/AmmeMemoRadiSam system protein A